MKLSLDSLNYAKTIYGGWDSLARAGLAAEIMHAYAGYHLHLNQYDRDQLCRIFYIHSHDEKEWENLVRRFK